MRTEATLDTLPTLWYPRCAKCGKKASPRASLGDAAGPRPRPRGDVTCDACGQRTRLTRETVWLPEPLEAR